MYRSGTKLPGKIYNFLLHHGGLGDLIGQLPAIKYILDHHKNIGINLYVHNYAIPLCQKVFKDYKNLVVLSVEQPFDESLPTRSPYLHNIGNLSCHITDHAFLTLVHKSVEHSDKNYLQLDPIDISAFNLPKRYVVITTGFTSETREWLPESVNGVANYCIERGYTPVYIGKSYTNSYLNTGIKGTFKADYSNGINLIDKTDLFEAHAIMEKSECVVGLDNGLLHLACMSNTPVVFGFTTVEPSHRLPYRHGAKGWQCSVVTPNIGCFGCQSNMNFAPQEHTFTKCFYDDYKCLTLMTVDKWIEELEGRLI